MEKYFLKLSPEEGFYFGGNFLNFKIIIDRFNK